MCACRRSTRRSAERMAAQLAEFLGGGEVPAGVAGRALGFHPSALRYAAPTGKVLIRWDGARQSTVRSVPAPQVDPADARLELARRHLRALGPTAEAALADWAGIGRPEASTALAQLGEELLPVRTPIGDAWILEDDEPSFRSRPVPEQGVRLLPSGDTYYMLHGIERELLVPDPDQRSRLWTSRVWPGGRARRRRAGRHLAPCRCGRRCGAVARSLRGPTGRARGRSRRTSAAGDGHRNPGPLGVRCAGVSRRRRVKDSHPSPWRGFASAFWGTCTRDTTDTHTRFEDGEAAA